jgi:hypothetical protein
MIDRNGAGSNPAVARTISRLADGLARDPNAHLQHRTLATPVIDDRQDPEGSPIGQGIMHKIHTPALGRSRRRGNGSSVQGPMLSPPDAHVELQSFEPVQPAHSFPIHPPAFATQEHPDAQVPKP